MKMNEVLVDIFGGALALSFRLPIATMTKALSWRAYGDTCSGAPGMGVVSVAFVGKLKKPYGSNGTDQKYGAAVRIQKKARVTVD